MRENKNSYCDCEKYNLLKILILVSLKKIPFIFKTLLSEFCFKSVLVQLLVSIC